MKIGIEAFLIRLQILCLVGIVVGQVAGQAGISSLLFTATFFLTAALWAAVTARGISRCSLLVIWILLLSGIAVCGNAVLSGTLVTASYLRKLVIFWAAIMQLGAMAEHVPEEATVSFLFRWNTLLACFLAAAWMARREAMYQINGTVTGYLTFRFTNPNLAAVFLCAIGMLEYLQAAWSGAGIQRCVHLLLAGLLAFFVWETRARNAQLLLLVFLLAAGGKQPRLRPFHGWSAVGIAVMPLAFAWLYLLLVDTPGFQKAFSFLAGEGKGLDSRVEIWRFALDACRQSPLLGAYSQISGGAGASQMHNSHLDILASYGVPVGMLVCLFLALILQHPCRKRTGFLCMAGFSSMLLSGMGEAMLFSGGMGIGLYAGMLRMLANYEAADREKRDENCLSQQLF